MRTSHGRLRRRGRRAGRTSRVAAGIDGLSGYFLRSEECILKKINKNRSTVMSYKKMSHIKEKKVNEAELYIAQLIMET